MADSNRELDLVLFGATGFTGRLTAQYLAGLKPTLRWGLAGRNRDKLEEERAQLGLGELPILVADCHDDAAVGAIARRTRVVCSTVGPYARYGSPLVAACADAGTSYCDLTGETDWVRAMLDAHQSRAVASGARIVPSCGFDSIPSDLGVLVLGEHFKSRGRRLAQARLRVLSLRGGPSGGTIASGLGIAERMKDPAVRRVLADPYALNPEGERSGPDRNDVFKPRRDAATGHWLAPFIMAAANTRVVRRSNALLGFPWGRDFRYEEVMDTGAGARGFGRAMAVSAGMTGFFVATATAPTRSLVARFLPAPGEGPDQHQRETGRFRIAIDGTGDDGSSARVLVSADRDPGYGATSIMLGQAALCLAQDKLPERSGFLTPATAMGELLLARMRAANIRFELEAPN
jgi:short subunit dehydrogenase-like uncharacterized protein